MSRKFGFKSIAGISLVVLTLVSAVSIPIWLNRWVNVDFPCEWFGNPPFPGPIPATSHLAYCISVYPRNANGGKPLYGSTSSDTAVLSEFGAIRLERQQNTLLVNNHGLEVGQVFHKQITTLTANPWLLSITELTITNQGLVSADQNAVSGTLLARGEAKESWAATPIPVAFLALGIALLLLDARDRNARTPAALSKPAV